MILDFTPDNRLTNDQLLLCPSILIGQADVVELLQHGILETIKPQALLLAKPSIGPKTMSRQFRIFLN